MSSGLQINNGQFQFVSCKPGGAGSSMVLQQPISNSFPSYAQPLYKAGYSNTAQMLSPSGEATVQGPLLQLTSHLVSQGNMIRLSPVGQLSSQQPCWHQ